MAPPFKQAEFDILYGKGISREGFAHRHGRRAGLHPQVRLVVHLRGRAAGSGQGERPHLPDARTSTWPEIEKKIKEKLGIGAVVTDDLSNVERPARPRRLLSRP